MPDEPNWADEAMAYDANAAINETRAMWLRMGRNLAEIVAAQDDFMGEDIEAANMAMAWAARAEACLWRATGDADTIDADRFIPELRDTRAGEANA